MSAIRTIMQQRDVLRASVVEQRERADKAEAELAALRSLKCWVRWHKTQWGEDAVLVKMRRIDFENRPMPINPFGFRYESNFP